MIRRRLIPFCLAVFAGLAAAPETARAACNPGDCWGAVAGGPRGAWGYAFNQPSRAAAAQVAQAGCRGRCDKMLTFHNSCGALAMGAGTGFGWGNQPTAAEAQQRALAECFARTRNCTIRAWACSAQ